MKIAGVVLAGGKSSRYGRPKMFEIYQNKHLYEYSVEVLKNHLVSPIVISTNENLLPLFHRNDVEYSIEKESDTYQGPLYAMYHTFTKIKDADWFFVLACDIPFITAEFVKMMINEAIESNCDAIVPTQSSKLQPLFALYHRNCIKKMEESINNKNRKLQLFLKEVNCLTISFSEEDSIFRNINSQNDWLN
ncbi:molybdenum cofactor guanylyltransferase [Gottfriedia luciferensis]|uniref:molybdenum cofactor guanylyltransferase n=1 Tax=Gottfriedia luciferensis TaxID=178774 RepID=UPI000B434C0A|nr:molybdenum cofactor guanylyltransferase [Gottfriedia luciferensis]